MALTTIELGMTTFPTGTVLPFAGTSATVPSGWLFPGGQAVSRTTYAALFAVLGTLYGAGDGSTTFNLPDLRGRAVAGKDDLGSGTSAGRLTTAGAGIDGDTLGAAGGAQTHTLTLAQMPAHTHTVGHGTNTGGTVQAQAGSWNNDTTTTTSSAGSGNAHNNTQPTLILNYIIKT